MEQENIKDDNLGMKEKVDIIFDSIQQSSKKKIKIPRKAKVSKGQMKKGWVGVLYVDENGNLKGEKTKLDGNTYREKKDIRYHATNGKEILMWEGKFPVTIQPTWLVNPISIKKDNQENQTYGQKYIMARMLADVIKIKKGGGMSIVLIIGLLIAGYIGYTFIFGG